MGVDVRKMLYDKISNVDNIFGVDLCKEFIDAGYELFGDKDRLEKCFRIGDFLGKDFGSVLKGTNGEDGVDVVYCGSIFHLLNLEQSLVLASHVRQMLCEDGFFFGRLGGVSEGENITVEREGRVRFIFSKKGLKEMLEKSGLCEVKVVEGEEGLDKVDFKQVPHNELKTFLSFSCFKRTK